MPANQTLTISKPGAAWADSAAAVTAVEAEYSDELNTWYDNAKANGELTAFGASLTDSDTLVITRTWSNDGWAAMSARATEAAAVKTALENAGYTVTDSRPDYV